MPYKSRAQQAAVAIAMKKAGKTPAEIKKHMSNGGAVPKGYHRMPDGSLMKDSEHKMRKGGAVKKKKKTKSKVNEAGNYTKPALRKRLFNEIKAGGKGGKPGQWSARKAQMLAKRYKEAGGGYKS